MTEYTFMHDGDFEWVEHGPETLYAEDCANKLTQLQTANNQLLSALERGYNRLDKRGADAQNVSSVKSILKEAIANAKGE